MLNQNKRKFLRLSACHLLRYKIIGKEGAVEKVASIKDISGGGLSFHACEAFNVEEKVALVLRIPFYPTLVNAVAKVTRVEELDKDRGVEVAVQFTTIDDEVKDFINTKVIDIKRKIARDKIAKKLILLFLIVLIGASLVALTLQFVKDLRI